MKKSALVVASTLILSISCSSNQLEKKSPEERKAEVYYGQGTTDLVNKDYSQALINLLEAKRLDPKNSQVRNNLGMTYYFKNQPQLAETELKEAIRLNGKNSEARLNLGTLYLERNQLKEAREYFESVLADLTFNNQYRNYYNLALLALKEGDRQSAFSHLESSLKEKNDYCPAHFKLGEMYSEEYKFQQALKAFKEAGKGTCVSLPAPIYHQGITLLNLNRNDEAQTKFKEVIEKHPGTKFSSMAVNQLKQIQNNNGEELKMSRGTQTEVIRTEQSSETPSF